MAFLCDDQGWAGPLPAMRERPDKPSLRVPLHIDEPLAGYLARFADRTGHASIKSLLSLSLPGAHTVREVLNGQRQDEFCELFDLPARSFEAATPRRAPASRWAIASETLPEGFFEPGMARACPRCLAADEAASGVGPQRRVEPHLRTFWMFPLVRACPIHGVKLIEAPGGLEGLASIARSNHRPAWETIPTVPATVAEITLAAVIAGHFGFTAPVAAPEKNAWILAMGLPTILTIATLVGFGLTGDPEARATESDWRRWMEIGLLLLVEIGDSLALLMEEIAARFPHLRYSDAPEFAFPDRPVAPLARLSKLRLMLPPPPANLAFESPGINERALCLDGPNQAVLVGDRAVDDFMRPYGSNARSVRRDFAHRLPARLTTRGGSSKIVVPTRLLLELLSVAC